MKANYPVEFLAASMTLDMGNTDKLSEFRAEAERLGIKVEPPSINRSGVAFEVEGNTIHYALAALKGVGAAGGGSDRRGARRASRSPTSPISPQRINPRAVNKRVLESLAAAGAFDALEPNRARVFAAVDTVLAARAARARRGRASGRTNCSAAAAARAARACRSAEPWLPAERLQREYDAIGFFLSGHPLDDYAAALKRLRVQSWAEFSRAVKAGATAGRVAGTVVSRTERRTTTGNKMGIIGLSDPSGHYEAVMFAEGLGSSTAICWSRAPRCCCSSRRKLQGDEVRARIQSVEPLDQAAAKMQKGLRVFLRNETPLDGVAKRLELPARRRGRRRRRGQHGADARRRHRGRGEAARPLQGLAADRRRDQGGAGRGGGRGGVAWSRLIAGVRQVGVKLQAETRHPNRYRGDRQPDLHRRLASAEIAVRGREAWRGASLKDYTGSRVSSGGALCCHVIQMTGGMATKITMNRVIIASVNSM